MNNLHVKIQASNDCVLGPTDRRSKRSLAVLVYQFFATHWLRYNYFLNYSLATMAGINSEHNSVTNTTLQRKFLSRCGLFSYLGYGENKSY